METARTEVWALVAQLHNLQEIFRVQGEILLHGEEAVEPLAALLLSPPSTFPQLRVAAAECLGIIGNESAIDALLRVLDHNDLQAVRPVQCLAEETVRNAAARQLDRFSLPQVVDALLASLPINPRLDEPLPRQAATLPPEPPRRAGCPATRKQIRTG